MERLQNLSAINTNTIEGRILMAALVKISERQPFDELDVILGQCQDLAAKIYKDAGDIPTDEEPKTFSESLTSLINKFSKENGSDTPDFILSNYLGECLHNYEKTVKARDSWFGVDMWNKATIESGN